MQGWWKSCCLEAMEQITGLKIRDCPPAEIPQAFVDAAGRWWNCQNYEHKREIYNKHNSNNE